MTESKPLATTIPRDLVAGLIVFLVALPLCLGIALASGAPLFSGLIAGIVGGILIGMMSGSHTSVSGPAAGLTAVVASQIGSLGSFEAFLLAVVIAGVLQIILGLAQTGALSAFFPSSVIKGLLAAIGVILIIKQTPYLLGYDMVPKSTTHGHSTILTQIAKIFTGEIHWGALLIGSLSMAYLIASDKIKSLKNSPIPAPLLVVVFSVLASVLLGNAGGDWALTDGARLLVSVPIADSMSGFLNLLILPDFSQLTNPDVYLCGMTLAIVASLETLLNLDAVDKLDRHQRLSPPNRELCAQGVGNVVSGMLGGLPVTSVVIRGSVNINSGSMTKLSTIFHGALLLGCVLLVPAYLNRIPLSCLAAILLTTGYKLASPKLFRRMWSEGIYQFLPFILTLIAIVATDLLIGVIIGMVISLLFILKSNLTQPIRQIVEQHVSGPVHCIELANQVSFLNKASLEKALRSIPKGGDAILDARSTDYIDPDVLGFIREFKDITAPAYNIRLSLRGFRPRYQFSEDSQVVDFSLRESIKEWTPASVQKILQDGNDRFRSGKGLDRNLRNLVQYENSHPQPLAVIYGGIDDKVPAELIFDVRLGELITLRGAGNAIDPRALGSLEYGCQVRGAQLIVLMGYPNSGLVKFALTEAASSKLDTTVPSHLRTIAAEIQEWIEPQELESLRSSSESAWESLATTIGRRHAKQATEQILLQSASIRALVEQGKVVIVGAVYYPAEERVEWFETSTVA